MPINKCNMPVPVPPTASWSLQESRQVACAQAAASALPSLLLPFSFCPFPPDLRANGCSPVSVLPCPLPVPLQGCGFLPLWVGARRQPGHVEPLHDDAILLGCSHRSGHREMWSISPAVGCSSRWVGMVNSLQVSLLLPWSHKPRRWALGLGAAPGRQAAAAREESKGRRKGRECFTAVWAVPASVFLSGFLGGWGFIYTKIDGFPTRLP